MAIREHALKRLNAPLLYVYETIQRLVERIESGIRL